MNEETPVALPETVFHQPSAILGHTDGVVLRVCVNAVDFDVLISGPNKTTLLNVLSHSLTDAELLAFRETLKRQNR